MRWFVSLVLVALGLSGCVGAPTTYGETVRSNYTPGLFGYGAGGRDLWTQFRGDPFGMGDEAFQAAMIDILARYPPRPQPAYYTTDPDENADTDFRVVFLFDPPIAFINSQICRLPLELPRGDGSAKPLRAAAAFCRKEGLLTAVRGSLDPAEGPDDPAFDALIGQMVYELFPTNDPDEDGDCGFPFRCR